MDNQNLFAALRAAFPQDLSQVAIECADGALPGAAYSWHDIDRGTAMLANLLASLGLPEGSRVAVQTEKSVEALMLYLAVLRAGYVFLPLNTAYQAAEIEYFIANAEPAVVVCAPKNFAWVSRIAFTAGTAHVFMPTTWPRSSTPAAPPDAARARCSATAICSATRACSRTTGTGSLAMC